MWLRKCTQKIQDPRSAPPQTSYLCPKSFRFLCDCIPYLQNRDNTSLPNRGVPRYSDTMVKSTKGHFKFKSHKLGRQWGTQFLIPNTCPKNLQSNSKTVNLKSTLKVQLGFTPRNTSSLSKTDRCINGNFLFELNYWKTFLVFRSRN